VDASRGPVAKKEVAVSLSVAVVGATGVVGEEFLRVLEQRRFPVKRLRLMASARSAGKRVTWGGVEHEVEDLAKADFRGVDVALFSAGSGPSRTEAPRVAKAGALVVDNSSAWRMDPEVPLVVPQVNGQAAHAHKGIIANPNCSTIILLMAVAPLERRVRIERLVVSTYQAVSGSGQAGLEELDRQADEEARGLAPTTKTYPVPIHRNVLPFVQAFGEGDITTEEWKMVKESRRILGRPDLRVTATCVRVPVRRAHSEAVNIEFARPVKAEEARRWIAEAPGVRVVDEPGRLVFPTPRDAEGKDEVLVGRIRQDPSHERGLDLWCTGDQIRKGAALNAVEIAEHVFGVGPAAPA
jgi:aspartate-semialdehyde dehydrogenase